MAKRLLTTNSKSSERPPPNKWCSLLPERITSHFGLHFGRPVSLTNLLVVLVVLCLKTAAAQQVRLISAQLNLDQSIVSKQATGQLELFRQSFGDPWIVDHCYELFISSPYTDPAIYHPFLAGDNAPVCTSLSEGVQVSCSVYSSDTLQFQLSSITEAASTEKAIVVEITNINTPFSSQNLRTINVRYYSDSFCQTGRSIVSAPSITIQQESLPASNVQVWSSSDLLGDTTSSNKLHVRFTPSTTMAPGGTGSIEIGIPYQYFLTTSGRRMYNPTAIKRCSSTCMNVFHSELVVDRLQIDYNNMVQDCISGQPIEIICRQFYNPIVPEPKAGFFVVTYDGEVEARIIEESNDYEIVLDATNYRPQTIPHENFIVNPTNIVIQSYSAWTMQLTVNIPLEFECWIELFLPSDFKINPKEIIASGIFMPTEWDQWIDVTQLIITPADPPTVPKSSIMFDGCKSVSGLGVEPFGSLQIANISTPMSMKDTDSFEIYIYKDFEKTKLISSLADGLIQVSGGFQPGGLTDVSMSAANEQVQVSSAYTVTFTTTHILLGEAGFTVRFPDRVQVPDIGAVVAISSPNASNEATYAIVVDENTIQVQGLTPAGVEIPAGTTISVTFQGVMNQNSVQDAGDFVVWTQNFVDGAYYTVDKQTTQTSVMATPGNILKVGKIVANAPINNAVLNTYTFQMQFESSVPPAGYIEVILPPEIVLQPSSTLSSGSCKQYTCVDVTESGLRFLITERINKGDVATLSVGGIRNPRSFAPTSDFTMRTFDIDGVHLIDVGYSSAVEMTEAGPITSFSMEASDFENGIVNTFTFSIQAQIPVIVGDKFTFTLPREMEPPVDAAAMHCQPLDNIQKMTCMIDGRKVTVIFDEFELADQAFTWTISGIKNPGSTKPSDPVSEIHFVDSQNYIVSSYSGKSIQITNSFPTLLVDGYSLEQGSLTASAVTVYTIKFTPINAMPSTGSIEIQFPQQVTLVDGASTACEVTTTHQVFNSNCQIDTKARTIKIVNIFDGLASYAEEITIKLGNVQNPVNNKPGNGFVIQTYWDDQQNFIMDKLNDFILTPKFECDYPCNQCSPTDPTQCTSCWFGSDDPSFLQDFRNGTVTCRPACEPGFTTNGDPQKVCVDCDESCLFCKDNGQVGDSKRCMQCAPDHPFRVQLSDTCLKKCALGMFLSSEGTCSYCKAPCEGCTESESKCTSCHVDSLLPQMFQQSCIDKCPLQYISVDGICAKCRSPCALCEGSVDNCVTCDGTEGTVFQFNGKCYPQCPVGSAPAPELSTCVQCLEGCDLCNYEDITECLTCTPPTVMHLGVCVDACPQGFAINDDGTTCRPWELADMGVIYFPFLVLALIATLVCLGGHLQKRAYINKQTKKMDYKSFQNTITCVIVALAPLQFLATIAQWVFSYLYGTQIFCLLALCVTVLAVILNVAFHVSFSRKFNRKYLPYTYERRVRLGKMTKAEAKQHLTWQDQQFIDHKKRHCYFAYMIFAATASISFKFNKCFYSYFYQLGAFRSHFSEAKYYRKMQTWYMIAHIICVDLALICIDITGLFVVVPDNQLFITIVETLVLSILSIVLGCIELWLLKDILAYTQTEQRKSKKVVETDSEEDTSNLDAKFDKKKMAERRFVIGRLVQQIKNYKSHFLNNKLDELLTQFGERKCQSMIDLATGWPLENDPRLTFTWPTSPAIREDYLNMDPPVKFTKEDAYGTQGNNVYADAKTTYMGMDFGTQDDQGFLEFQDALTRKAGGLLSTAEADLEERRKLKNRRRGRKNKYYAAIDHEDDLEADEYGQDPSDNQDTLQVIREQNEEEDQIRNQIAQARLTQEALAAQRKQTLSKQQSEQELRQKHEIEQQQQRAAQLKEQAVNDAKIAKERALQAQAESLKLQQQAELELSLKREQDEKQKVLRADQSLQAREEYERAEAERLRLLKAKEESEREQQRVDEQARLKQEREDKEKALAQKLQAQAERDAAGLAQKQAKQKEEDAQRLLVKQQAKEQKAVSMQIEAANIAAAAAEMPSLPYQQESEQVEPPRRQQVNESEMHVSLQMGSSLEKNFPQVTKVDCPPDFSLRTFNVHDILGDHDRDDKGNLIVGRDADNNAIDREGKLTNERGYLLDSKTGAVIENQTGGVMFHAQDLDATGEIPAPFSLENHNFNPHNLMGDFDYKNGQPELLKTSQGFFMDKKSRRVNKHGWMTQANREHLVEFSGLKRFDKTELQKDGDLMRLFTYQAKRFDIKDVMGIFDKDPQGHIIPRSAQTGHLVDNNERRVNEKGYLIDAQGNIIDTKGQVLWIKQHLKNGEFPKIFPFTKFNISRVRGDFPLDKRGKPVLKKRNGSQWVDRAGRLVNQHGYLADAQGNVIDVDGKLMFEKSVLEADGQLPPVFLNGYLLSEGDADQISVLENDEKHHETSMDSKMGDTPANYAAMNNNNHQSAAQVYEPIQSEEEADYGHHLAPPGNSDGGQDEEEVAQRRLKKKPKKKKPKMSTVELLQPTVREKSMAGAYGGQAIGSIRRPGVKYDEERLKGSKKFRVSTADEHKVRAQLTNLIKGTSNSMLMQTHAQLLGKGSSNDSPVKRQQFHDSAMKEDMHSNGSLMKASRRADSRAIIQTTKPKDGKRFKDSEFEQMFGNDIDQFLEDSNLDLDSVDGQSLGSRASNNSRANQQRLRQMEKAYLNRMDNSAPRRQPGSRSGSQGEPMPRTKQHKASVLGPDRETILNFSDNPGVIHRGEILPFVTKKTNQTKK